MKKALALLLPFVILYNLGGYHYWYSAEQCILKKEIKQKIKAGLQDEELTLIIAEPAQIKAFQWIKPGKEFMLNDRMYDVVRTENVNGKIYYYCIDDVREKELIAHWTKESRSRKDSEKWFKRTIHHYYLPHCMRIVKQVYCFEIDFLSLNYFLQSGYCDDPSPPPKNA